MFGGSLIRLNNEISNQTSFAGSVFTIQDHGLAKLGVGCKGRLDLAELDAMPADLDLAVTSAQVVKLSVGSPPREIA